MTPLVLVVGFLGSGKTTFLKSLVPALAARGIRPGLLINDYQNATVDAEQFRSLVEGVKALSGDCVCCGSREQLLSELQSFEHGPQRVMLVETNGTTDAEQIVESLGLDPTLRKFTLPIQLSIVDGQRWQKRFWHNTLEREQCRPASHLYISRQEVIAPERLEDVVTSLHERGCSGTFTDPETFANELAALTEDTRAEREFSPVCEHGCDNHDHNHDEHPVHTHAAHHFASCEFLLPEVVSRGAFRDMLRQLPHDVLRAKGLVRFDDEPNEFYVFQKVDASEDPQFFPVGSNPRVKTPLALFIGPQLSIPDLESSIRALKQAA